MKCLVLVLALVLGTAGMAQPSEPITLKVAGGELHGTLEVPKGAPPWPVALIVSGSGPTDRDGNNTLVGRNDSLKMLAQGLAARGAASLRYDKRGVAASAAAGPKEADLRFDAYIADAEQWGGLLLRDPRFRGLIIIGHSEGALIGAKTSQSLEVRGFVSIAGAGQPASRILAAQLHKNLPPDLLSQSNRILGLLGAGKNTDQVPASLMILFRPSVQPYLISWFAYDPVREVSRIKAPCLIVQGATDMQVSVSDAQQLAKANSQARLLIIPGMNHVLKMAPRDPALQRKSYGDPSLPVSRELVDGTAAFIKQVGRGN